MATVSRTIKVKDSIMELVPEEWKHDQAFLNLAKAIHTVAYMKLARHTVRKYMKYRKIDRVEKIVHNEARIIEKSLIDYLTDKKNKIRNGSKRVEFAVLKLLLVQNDVVLNWSKIAKVIGRREKNKNRSYTIEEIRQMLNYAPDNRSKVVILLLASTGIRIEGLATLTVGNLKAIEHEGYKFYSVVVYAGEPEEYVTFTTQECAKAIDDYLNFRKRIKEPIKPSSPLIRDEVDMETALAFRKRRIAKPVSVRALEHLLRKIVAGSGVRQSLSKTIDEGSKVRYEAHLSRGFRKFFYTTLVEAGVEPVYREYMHGHLDGSQNLDSTNLMMVYTTPKETKLFQSYLKAVDSLTISNENRLKKKLQEKQRVDESSLKQTIAGMIEQYLSKRDQLDQKHHSLSPEEFEKEIERVEKMNPIESLLSESARKRLGL